ncbi:MAG: hypothetical protein SPI09_07975 [Candidatus Limivicinus sp.]|nr:hypothetical protein [Candidatus Limivicinus sp.]
MTELYFFTISAPPDEEAEWSHFLLTMEGAEEKHPLMREPLEQKTAMRPGFPEHGGFDLHFSGYSSWG